MTVDELRWEAPIEVTDHAVDRARARLAWGDTDIAEAIKVEVRFALLHDRVTAEAPAWLRGAPGGSYRHSEYDFYAANVGRTRAWVLKANSDATRLLVTTLLLSGGDPERIGNLDDARLRSGMVRR